MKETDVCVSIIPIYYGERSGAFRGDPYNNSKNYYYECVLNSTQASSIIDLCKDCNNKRLIKIDKPKKVDPNTIRRAIVTERGLEYID